MKHLSILLVLNFVLIFSKMNAIKVIEINKDIGEHSIISITFLTPHLPSQHYTEDQVKYCMQSIDFSKPDTLEIDIEDGEYDIILYGVDEYSGYSPHKKTYSIKNSDLIVFDAISGNIKFKNDLLPG